MIDACPTTAPQGARRSRLRWRWWLVIACVGLILLASTSLMSAERTGQVIKQLTHWAIPNASADQLRRLNFVIRKSAHLTEYAVLAALTAWAITAAFPSTERGTWFFLTLALASIVAISDEFHQSLVPNRTGAVRDVVIDVCGALLALVAIAIWRWHHPRKPESTAGLIRETVKEILGPQWKSPD